MQGDGEVVIYELDDDGAWWRAWWFALAPGDVWAMPGGSSGGGNGEEEEDDDDGGGGGEAAGGYVRWACDHAVPLVGKPPQRACRAGCAECRISLNLRFG